jgi:UDP-N-acetylglucosamine--N-acetylmuramyl-(pentapeptide) pyrophosphoryl-undecaprenol N-acetylglucosamine transferase
MGHEATIVLTAGGTGGHITPILAVASELKKLRPDIRLVYIGEKGGVLTDIPANHPAIDATYSVRAGKFRRYHGQGWRQIFDIATQAHNIRDAARLLAGIWQSFWLLRRLHPSAIFTRGGYVSVPVALGGRLNGIPYITHDSDSTPSLANRLIGRGAARHAVGLAPELYPYPKAKTTLVGVPVSGEYRRVTTELQHKYRRELGLPERGRMLFATGGGNGADALNRLLARSAPELLRRYPDLTIMQTAGRSHEVTLNQLYDEALEPSSRKRVVVLGFVSDMYRYTGAADVVVARAGASTLAELAVQGKACIVIPASLLAWQEHQAQTLADQHAIIKLRQHEAEHDGGGTFVKTVSELLDQPKRRRELADALHAQAIPDAAKRLAVLLLDVMRAR